LGGHIRYMNDPRDFLRAAAGSRLANEHGPNREWLAEVLQAAQNPQQTDVFAVCFLTTEAIG